MSDALRPVFLAADEHNLLLTPPHIIRPASRRTPSRSDPVVKALLPANRTPDSRDWHAARRDAAGWRDRLFRPEEVRAWLAAGVQPGEAELAYLCVCEGLKPGEVTDIIQDPDSGQRLTILDAVRQTRGRDWLNGGQYVSDELDRLQIPRRRQPDPFARRRTASA